MTYSLPITPAFDKIHCTGEDAKVSLTEKFTVNALLKKEFEKKIIFKYPTKVKFLPLNLFFLVRYRADEIVDFYLAF